MKRLGKITKESTWFYVFISPWILGFIVFILGPIIFSIIMSFTDYNMFTEPNFIGLDNYKSLIKDDLFWLSLRQTFSYAIVSVPLNLLLSLGMAYLLNHKLRGMRVFRTVFYLPSLVPIVASALIFKILLAPDGYINAMLGLVGIDGPNWLLDTQWVKYSIVWISIWAVGTTMILVLSSLQGVPQDLYESASIDGANKFTQFRKITIPMISPVLFFNLVMGIINALKAFSEMYILTKGGLSKASLMIVPYLFNNAFKYYRMGYASAIAWALFIIIIILTTIVFKSSSMWVYYEGEVKK